MAYSHYRKCVNKNQYVFYDDEDCGSAKHVAIWYQKVKKPSYQLPGTTTFNFFYLTFTLHFFVIFPDLIVIVAVPFFFALTTPFPDTVAIFLFEDLYVMLSGFPR